MALAVYGPLARAPKRFVNEAVFGMLVAASPVLSEMARAVRSWGQCLDYIWTWRPGPADAESSIADGGEPKMASSGSSRARSRWRECE